MPPTVYTLSHDVTYIVVNQDDYYKDPRFFLGFVSGFLSAAILFRALKF